jgi:hypothetical protein
LGGFLVFCATIFIANLFYGLKFVEIFLLFDNQKQVDMKPKKMLIPVIFFAALFAFSGCMSTYPTTIDPFRIKEFPTPRHNNEVKIYFPGEQVPDKEYIQTHAFEALNFPNAPLSVQVSQIRDQAMAAGVDAVIIMSHGNHNRALPYGGFVRENILTGLGIKFKENVDYLHMYRFVDQLYAFNADKDTLELVANLFPDFNGKVTQVEDLNDSGLGKYYFENFIRRYSLDFLLGDESPNWRFKTTFDGRATRRDYAPGGRRTIRVKPAYEPGTKKLTGLEANYLQPDQTWVKKQITVEYGPNRMVSEKVILQNGVPELIERFYYDDLDRLLTSTYFQVVDGQERVFLQTHYYYYEEKDVFEQF